MRALAHLSHHSGRLRTVGNRERTFPDKIPAQILLPPALHQPFAYATRVPMPCRHSYRETTTWDKPKRLLLSRTHRARNAHQNPRVSRLEQLRTTPRHRRRPGAKRRAGVYAQLAAVSTEGGKLPDWHEAGPFKPDRHAATPARRGRSGAPTTRKHRPPRHAGPLQQRKAAEHTRGAPPSSQATSPALPPGPLAAPSLPFARPRPLPSALDGENCSARPSEPAPPLASAPAPLRPAAGSPRGARAEP